MSVAEFISLGAAAACFAVGLIALLALRGRLELVARAEHELRGPATALGLACRQLRHDPAAVRHAEVIEAQLERLRAGLDDLAAARRGGGRAATDASSRVDVASFVRAALEPWRTHLQRCSVDLPPGAPVAVADRGRLAQALGNLLANSAEHGAGDLRLRARRVPGAVRLEVRNQNRAAPRNAHGAAAISGAPAGRGLAIAEQAARDLGGRLLVHTEGAATVAVLELPDGPVDRVDRPRANAADPPPAGSDPAEHGRVSRATAVGAPPQAARDPAEQDVVA